MHPRSTHTVPHTDYDPQGDMRLLFVTPAHSRYSVSDFCFAQRAHCIQQLANEGIQAQAVIIACDDNIDIATQYGFATIESDNSHLGKRWNDGYAYAAEHGYTHIAPIGSDSWIDPDYFLPPPSHHTDTILTSSLYATIDEDGSRIAHLTVEPAGGVGPHTFPTRLIAQSGNRPVQDNLDRGCDHSLLNTIRTTHRKPLQWEWRNRHPLQYVAFRSHGTQINPYQQLRDRYSTNEHHDPWGDLNQHYPHHLVALAQEHYANIPPPPETAHTRAASEARARAEAREQRRQATNR